VNEVYDDRVSLERALSRKAPPTPREESYPGGQLERRIFNDVGT
jgi:hypothetical protein